MFSDWVSFLAYPNLFGIKGFVVVVCCCDLKRMPVQNFKIPVYHNNKKRANNQTLVKFDLKRMPVQYL
jgi:hypothetical protein